MHYISLLDPKTSSFFTSSIQSIAFPQITKSQPSINLEVHSQLSPGGMDLSFLQCWWQNLHSHPQRKISHHHEMMFWNVMLLPICLFSGQCLFCFSPRKCFHTVFAGGLGSGLEDTWLNKLRMSPTSYEVSVCCPGLLSSGSMGLS